MQDGETAMKKRNFTVFKCAAVLRLRRLCRTGRRRRLFPSQALGRRSQIHKAVQQLQKQLPQIRKRRNRLRAMQKRAGKIAKLTINGQEFAVTLYDTPAANALYELLPLELTFADFNGIKNRLYGGRACHRGRAGGA